MKFKPSWQAQACLIWKDPIGHLPCVCRPRNLRGHASKNRLHLNKCYTTLLTTPTRLNIPPLRDTHCPSSWRLHWRRTQLKRSSFQFSPVSTKFHLNFTVICPLDDHTELGSDRLPQLSSRSSSLITGMSDAGAGGLLRLSVHPIARWPA